MVKMKKCPNDFRKILTVAYSCETQCGSFLVYRKCPLKNIFLTKLFVDYLRLMGNYDKTLSIIYKFGFPYLPSLTGRIVYSTSRISANWAVTLTMKPSYASLPVAEDRWSKKGTSPVCGLKRCKISRNGRVQLSFSMLAS